MCGIAGWIDAAAGRERRETAVARMCEAQRHRGPDDGGWRSAGRATLGMRRLSIIDVERARQPMVSPDGRWTLVFNGEIYNFRQLRPELEKGGGKFRTDGDTEVLLALVSRDGIKALPRLRGMFAFALWDDRNQSLLLARDGFGIKPLYVARRKGGLLFASEVRALLASGEVEARPDPTAVDAFLAWLSVPAPLTLYRGITSLLPGEWLHLAADGALSTGRFTRLPEPGGRQGAEEGGDFTAGLRERFEESVRTHMVADVPVGVFLSGGLDSSLTAAVAARTLGGRMKVFTIGLDDGEADETGPARAAADAIGAEHVVHRLTGLEVAGQIGQVTDALDLPTGDGVNVYYASRLAHQGGVKVVLSGLGGDEWFGGYPSFRDVPRIAPLARAAGILPGPLRRAAASTASSLVHPKLGDMIRAGGRFEDVCSRVRLVFAHDHRRSLFTADVRESLSDMPDAHPMLGLLAEETAGWGTLERVRWWEASTYMTDTLLRDADVMGMAHSIELRVPLVDEVFVRWVCSRHESLAGGAKRALAEAASAWLPPGVCRRPKRGFSLPFHRWMRGALRPFLEDTFAAGCAGRSGLLDPAAVAGCWRGFRDREPGDPAVDRNWSRVWSLAMLITVLNRPQPR